MRVAILGAGAMGSVFGAQLAEGGLDTLLVDVNEQVVANLNGEGVLIKDKRGERRAHVRATTNPKKEEPADLVVVFVKSWATDSAMKLASGLIAKDTQVLSLQNGWGNGELLAPHVPAERVLLGVTYHSANVGGAGIVNHTATGPTYIGPFRGKDTVRAAAIASAFTGANVQTEAAADIAPRIWRKLMLNLAANPVAALTGLYSSQLMQQADVASLMKGLAREAVMVANAEGQNFDADETIEYIGKSLDGAGLSTASMRQDVMGERPTEIEVITGAIIRAADRHGIDAPLNRVLYALVKGYEAAQEMKRAPQQRAG